MAGLEDLYREIILDHYRNPRNRGELEVPPAVQAVGFNPLCGDEVIVYVDVQDGVITDVSTGGQGCSISQSSASMMSIAIKGRKVSEVRRLVRAFKHMMSIHGTGIGGTGDDLDDDGDTGNGAGDVKLGDLEALRGVVKFPVRIKCATLSWNTLVQALDETFA
ncbi:MAG: SUF system NifU family Fe-S cluster assembly protein [Acidimicrobiaceae bacterium]|nr:SUF system NifU family Fe-S cluster assembly protein [Acidimicrobiaceae bacterium]MYE08568.1 SUF system NifU family Fe-S cluster assembly protein [Acidimicrobiaceae bacterium]MYI37253.1 SUF system NifU family Fe-S cluster assembly protein [Acidimicrobiaceae bacterium]